MASTLEVREGLQYQATFMAVIYKVDVADQMSGPTSAAVESVINDQGTDVKSTVMPSGSASIVNTTEVKLPKLQSLAAGRTYIIRFSFSDADNKLGGQLRVNCPF